jgi:hypothetical protein
MKVIPARSMSEGEEMNEESVGRGREKWLKVEKVNCRLR